MVAVHLESGKVEVRKTSLPRRAEGMSLVRLLAGGICNTDLELQRGYYGFAGRPGHEFVGEVVASDRVELVSRRVVGEINLSCRRCDWCRRGLGRHCPKRTVLGIVKHPGAFAEYLTLPDSNLHLVPERVSTEEAVFVEPLGAACEILDQVRIRKGERVAVLGDGKLGLLIAQVLASHGAAVTQYGRHKEKLRLSAARGVETIANARKLPAAAFPFVVDATGSAAGLGDAVRMTAPRGTVILKSTVHGAVALDAAPVIVNEITLTGSRCGRFEPALRLLQSGKVDVKPMIAERYPLSRAAEAFTRAGQKGVLKVLLTPDA